MTLIVKTFKAIGVPMDGAKGVEMKRVNGKFVGVWTLIASMLFLATAQPSAYGLEFPPTSNLALPDSEPPAGSDGPVISAAALYGTHHVSSNRLGSIFSSEMALVSNLSRQVEVARSPDGARKVARVILLEEYGLGKSQYACLNSLWTKESNWRYKAHNRRSGAHGIPQALPAIKMDVIATDWRTNPVTQIRWGLRYINIRYETPCKAWTKFKKRNTY